MGVNVKDQNILMGLFARFHQDGLAKDFSLSDAILSSIKFSNHVNAVSRCLGSCKIVFEPAEGDKQNEAQVVFDIAKRGHYVW